MKKVFLAMAVAGFLTMGCGTSEKGGTIDEDISFESADMAIEDISPEDLSEEVFGVTASPPALSPMADSSGKGILIHLNPNKVLKGCRVPILKVIEGPIHIGKFFTLNPQPCAEVVEEGACPALKTGDVYTRTFTLSDCPLGVSLPGGITDVITFTGSLTQSVEIKGINQFVDSVTAVNLKISSQNTGAYISYDGFVSADVTVTMDGHKLVLSARNLRVQDSSGAEGIVNGTRTVEVIKDKSIKISNAGTITYISPNKEETIIELQMSKDISIDGDVKTITLSDSIITNGVERTREGTITITREINEGDVLKEIVIDGEETLTGPKGTFYVTIDDLTLDINCWRNPRGGTITVSNGEKEIKIVFKDSCSCEATLILPDGTEKQIDSCSLRRSLCR
jgi:hypothetical protein